MGQERRNNVVNKGVANTWMFSLESVIIVCKLCRMFVYLHVYVHMYIHMFTCRSESVAPTKLSDEKFAGVCVNSVSKSYDI